MKVDNYTGQVGAKVSEFLLCAAYCGNDGYNVVGMNNMNDAYEIKTLATGSNHKSLKF